MSRGAGVTRGPDVRFEVFRDAWGVPHVRAGDELALAYGQGWVTARDRTWQVQTDRWRAEGRLAEHIGPGGVAWDVVAHRLDLPGLAQRAYSALADADRAWVDAHVAGVNAGLASARPPWEVTELDRVLGGTTPDDPWPAWAPLGVFLVNHALFSTFPRVLWHDHVARAARASDLLVDVDPLELVRLFDPSGDGPTSGSNAWALHGSRTATGAPLLAGDPHRVLELPGPYQQIRLACDEYDVLGLAFPGVPGLPHFGHAGDAAWGITNAVAHSAETYRELLLHDGDAWRAIGPDGSEPVDVRTVQVRVRGGDVLTVEALATARGPVVVRGMPPGRAVDQDGVETGAVPLAGLEEGRSVRLQAADDADLGFACLRPLLRARTARDVADAMAGWVDPVNRVVAADSAGAVLTFDAGRVADRDPGDRWLSLRAWDAAHAPRPWRRLAAPVEVDGFVVDANDRPLSVDRDHGAVYSPDRGERIRALLAGRATWDVDDLADVHGDTHWAGAGRLLRHLVGVDGLSAEAAAVRDRLLAWDLHMDADSADAALLAALRAALVARLVDEPALRALDAPHHTGPAFDAWFSLRGRVGAALPALLGRADLGIDGPAHVRAALEEVAAGAGTSERRTASGDAVPGAPGTWGERHTVLPAHVLADVPGATVPTVPVLPLGGDQDTVRCTGTVPGVTDRAFRGSVARWIWDLGDRSRSRWGVPFGASGDPRSPHFADQHPMWAAAETVEIELDWTRLTRDPTPS